MKITVVLVMIAIINHVLTRTEILVPTGQAGQNGLHVRPRVELESALNNEHAMERTLQRGMIVMDQLQLKSHV